MINKSLLLAGTRLTGDMPHIGTYYGWITQIKRALDFHDVVILIADYQSFDVKLKESISNEAKKLKSIFNYFLPTVPVVIESEVKDILKLGMLISGNIKPRYYKRIMPIRKHLDENNDYISYPHLFYPSLMIANILAIGATHVFDKPEGKFQHIEVLNDIINDLNKKFDSNIPYIQTFKKLSYDIMSLDGTGPMKRKRAQNGVIEVYNTTRENILQKLQNVQIINKSCAKGLGCPELQNVQIINKSCAKGLGCPVIESIWNAASDYQSNHKSYISCEKCLAALADKIWLDITDFKETTPNLIQNNITKDLNENTQKFISLFQGR